MKKYVLPALFAAIFVYLRLINIGRAPWEDELISIATLNEPIFKNPLLYGVTTNLPLYFWILKFWVILFGNSIFTLRLLSILANALTAVSLYVILSKKHRTIALLTVLFFTLSPLQIYYSQEIRPYAFLQFILVAQVFYFTKLALNNVVEKKATLMFIALSLAAALTHISACYLFVAEGILLVYLKRKKAGIALLYVLVPLFISLLLSFTNPNVDSAVQSMELESRATLISVSSLPKETVTAATRIKEVIVNYYWFGLHYYLVSLNTQMIIKKLFLALFALAIYKIIKNKDKGFIVLLCLFMLVLLQSYVGEILGVFPFGGRHIMAFSPVVYIFTAYAINALFGYKKAKILVYILLFYISFVLLSQVPCDELIYTKENLIGNNLTRDYSWCITKPISGLFIN